MPGGGFALSAGAQEDPGVLKHLRELLQSTAPLGWEGVTLAVDGLIEILEDHEKKEDYWKN